MQKKLEFIVPLALLLVLGGVYKFVLAKPPAAPELKVEGSAYPLPKEFVVNLAGGRYAKLNVALVLEHLPAPPTDGSKPPEGYGCSSRRRLYARSSPTSSRA